MWYSPQWQPRICRELDGLFGVVFWEQMGEVPTGLSHRGQLLREVRSVRGPPAIERHPQSPPTTGQLIDGARSPHAPISSFLCHPDPVRRETTIRPIGAIHLTGLALQELPDVVDGTTVQLQDVVDSPVS